MNFTGKIKNVCTTIASKKCKHLVIGAVFGTAVVAVIFYLTFSGPCSAKTNEPPKTTLEISSAASTAATKPVRVSTTKASRGYNYLSASYPGTVKASQTANLTFRVGGPIIEVVVHPGDQVKKGDVLMRIDPRDFQSQVSAIQSAIEAAQAKLAAMEKGARVEDLRVLEANIAATEAKGDYAREQFKRFGRLVEKNAISKSQYDAAQSELLASEAATRALRQQLVKAKAGSRVEEVNAMKAEIRGLQTRLQVAKDALADTSLRAPFDGTITKQLFEAHEMVSDKKVVLMMHDISTLEVLVSLPERELIHRDLTKPVPVDVRFHATGDRLFKAHFSEIDTEANPQTRTYAATFVMKSPEDVLILPGMTAEVSVAAQGSGGDVISVPLTSIISDGDGKDYVWVVGPDHKAEQRPIVRGRILQGNRCEVREGLADNEEVVTLGAKFVYRGVTLDTSR